MPENVKLSVSVEERCLLGKDFSVSKFCIGFSLHFHRQSMSILGYFLHSSRFKTSQVTIWRFVFVCICVYCWKWLINASGKCNSIKFHVHFVSKSNCLAIRIEMVNFTSDNNKPPNRLLIYSLVLSVVAVVLFILMF